MKKLLSITAVLMVLFIGCSKDVNINSPVQDQVTEEFVTRTVPEGLQVNTSFTVSKLIVGADGGYLYTGNQYATIKGTLGSIYAVCIFPKGAFIGSKTITMTVDDKTLTGTFLPSMTFDKPASFSVLFTGVDLSNYTQDQFTFVYYDKNNNKYEISGSFLYFDKVKGVLGILNAQLPHFSRYGFVRKAAK